MVLIQQFAYKKNSPRRTDANFSKTDSRETFLNPKKTKIGNYLFFFPVETYTDRTNNKLS